MEVDCCYFFNFLIFFFNLLFFFKVGIVEGGREREGEGGVDKKSLV